jgi:hypothetical protein
VQWTRAGYPGNAALLANVGKLVHLRTSHPALQRNEVDFFYFHPQFDANGAPRVFAYCRTGGQSLGSNNQVVVIANMGGADYANYDIPNWPWASALTEVGGMSTGTASYNAGSGVLSLPLPPFNVRVLRS